MAQNRQINQFELSGKILHIGQPEEYISKAGSTIITRSLVIECIIGTNTYPHEFIFNQSNMGQLADVREGEWATINFAIGGNSSIKDGKTRYWNKSHGLTIIKG